MVENTLENTLENAVASPAGEPQVVVRIKPGTSSDKGLMFELEPEMEGYSIKELVDHAVRTYSNDPVKGRIASRLQREMSRSHGYTANQTSVTNNEKISKYISDVKTLDDGTKYKEIEIVVAAQQEGGTYRR